MVTSTLIGQMPFFVREGVFPNCKNACDDNWEPPCKGNQNALKKGSQQTDQGSQHKKSVNLNPSDAKPGVKWRWLSLFTWYFP